MMDSFEWNKILGGVLGALLFVVGLNILIDELMTPEKPTSGGMTVATTETPSAGPTAAAEVKPDWGTVLPAADVAAGEKVHQRCLQCHDFSKGGPNKIGPNLYGIVGNKRAHEPSFSYSGAMKSAGGTWGYDELDAFLTSPRADIPGTKMTFAGLSRQQDRINLIAWLRTQSDSPLPIPAPKPAAPAPAASGPDGEGPASQMQAPQPGETPQPAAPGAAPATPPASGSTAPAETPAPATAPGH
ncbi:MAG: c-type cytochrome [Alphaproteobacteria bacterium]|nr:c-type cytochrome [Alphaproteobacteria bacterium]